MPGSTCAPRRWTQALGLAVLGWAAAGGAARAGGGPENVALVVNAASWASQTVANYYAALRQIPPANLIPIQWRGSLDQVDGATFREQILGPALAQIERRGLAPQIDYLVYSSDFPLAVNLAGDFPGVQIPPPANPVCSLTGATYYAQAVLAGSPATLALRGNLYARTGEAALTSSQGFRAWYGWGPGGQLLESGGQRYLLSTVLAVTSGRGNSLREAVAALTRSAAADGTFPKGTIYFARSSDVRSTTRAAGFAAAVAELERLGVAAEIVEGAWPSQKPDVQGAMLGVADFSWTASRSTILPGAICEHLTSFGGILGEGASQTPLSELIRHGAAGASGTVVEPFAIQDKFPLPAVHVHYARGCSLAEAFYQSVAGPFQLLIVGDPLCRPWARIPQVAVSGLPAQGLVSGAIELRAQVKLEGGRVDRCELFVDGRRAASAPAGQPLRLNTHTLADGFHELRVVAVEAGPIESQGRAIVPVQVNNRQRTIEVDPPQQPGLPFGRTLELAVRSPGSRAIVAAHAGRIVGQLEAAQGTLRVDSRSLGNGPAALQVIGLGSGGGRDHALASPVSVNVLSVPQAALPRPPVGRLVDGLLLTTAAGATVPVQSTREPQWLAAAGVRPGETFLLEAYFQVPADDAYQFQLEHRGQLKLSVGDALVYQAGAGQGDRQFVPVSLAKGLHRMRLEGTAGEPAELRAWFGGLGTASLAGREFRHPQ